MTDNDKTFHLTKRVSFREYYMNIAIEVSKRSNCLKRNVGAIIVKDNKILSTGYNGTPSGMMNCLDGGCKRCLSGESGNLDQCFCIHAE